jgi:hypothetical protein
MPWLFLDLVCAASPAPFRRLLLSEGPPELTSLFQRALRQVASMLSEWAAGSSAAVSARPSCLLTAGPCRRLDVGGRRSLLTVIRLKCHIVESMGPIPSCVHLCGCCGQLTSHHQQLHPAFTSRDVP